MKEMIECGMGVRLVRIEVNKVGLKPYTDYNIVNDHKELKNEVHY